MFPLKIALVGFLGADIVATHPVPPFDRSPDDGYALRSMDTLNQQGKNRYGSR